MTPKTKVFVNGERVRDIKGRFAAKAGKAYRFVKRWTIIGGTAYALFFFGGLFYSTHDVEAITTTVEAASPIMDRIADCESGNGKAGSASQYGKSGQVLISVNTNGTVDIGKFQINSIHNAEATKLGFNLSTEEGNTAYAKYLYSTKGTTDWASSYKCWSK